MLSIGQFSKICGVSPKTLRYYAQIGLLLPNDRNSSTGYRYYSIAQLEDMLYINRLKTYEFSLDDIKKIMKAQGTKEDQLYIELCKKREAMKLQIQTQQSIVQQIEEDMQHLLQGASLMSYMDDIAIQLVEVDAMQILYIRSMVMEEDMARVYQKSFTSLFQKIRNDKLTIIAPPMVLFHSDEFTLEGMDIEFAIPIKEHHTGTRDFHPGLCLKTVLHGAYGNLPSIYAKQIVWAKEHGYENVNALFEMYVKDPSCVTSADDMITEVYYPVCKKI